MTSLSKQTKEESRDEKIARYMKLSKKDLAIMLTDSQHLIDVIVKKANPTLK